MNINDVISYLSKFDGETMVVIAGYEGGISEVSDVSQINIRENVNTEWYYGEHEQDREGETKVVYIGS